MNEFKRAFEATGTSKVNHGYHDFYAQMLNGVDIDSVLEIGVYLGQSLKSWKMVWPEALIEAVDYDMRFEPSLLNEFTIFTFDSRSKIDVKRYIDRSYDLIIDDGLHHWKAQLETFANFENLANKFYVIEDVCGDYSYKNIMNELPQEVKDRSTVFVGTGPPRTFRHGNHVEKDAEYRIIFIDQRLKK